MPSSARKKKKALDAFEAAASANGHRDARHQIAPLHFVHPADRPRFRRLFFFNDTATIEIYPLSLHDALPIWRGSPPVDATMQRRSSKRLRMLRWKASA